MESPNSFKPESDPHRRLNPLTGEWILVSPHRTQRPWQGQRESLAGESRPAYDPTCYLCPGNKRAGDATNPSYRDTFVFNNDFSALLPAAVLPSSVSGSDLFRVEPVRGECRVLCFSPRHDLTLPEMDVSEIRKIVEVWGEQLQELGQRYKWVQIFENKGAAMGCSNPHPHGQIWASNFIPQIPAREDTAQREYYDRHGRALLTDYAASELEAGVRIVEQNSDWLMVVPHWATWPFEYLLLPLRPAQRLTDLTSAEKQSCAEILKASLVRYDNLFETSFPYSMGWHGAPIDGEANPHWQLHAHFYPPLLRSATVKKFMVGYEMLGESQRDLTPEQAALRLRQVPAVHYKAKP